MIVNIDIRIYIYIYKYIYIYMTSQCPQTHYPTVGQVRGLLGFTVRALGERAELQATSPPTLFRAILS